MSTTRQASGGKAISPPATTPPLTTTVVAAPAPLRPSPSPDRPRTPPTAGATTVPILRQPTVPNSGVSCMHATRQLPRPEHACHGPRPSPRPLRRFQVLGSSIFPCQQWVLLGEFEANDTRSEQVRRKEMDSDPQLSLPHVHPKPSPPCGASRQLPPHAHAPSRPPIPTLRHHHPRANTHPNPNLPGL